jgi:hypothetical protein
VTAVYILRAFIAQDWHPFVRLLGTGAVVAAIMILGVSILYRRHWHDYVMAFARTKMHFWGARH